MKKKTDQNTEPYITYTVDSSGKKSDAFLLNDIPKASLVVKNTARKFFKDMGASDEEAEIFVKHMR